MSGWAAKTDEMTALARSPAPEDRERLLNAVADLCEAGEADHSERSRELIQTIFLDLVQRAERDIRLRLAERIASAPWAPTSLVCTLAADDIEIARPIIAKSPALGDADLIRLLVTATIEHQIEVARRPAIGSGVVSAILDQADPSVMTALAGNDTAEVSELAMSRMVVASKTVAAMRAPLSRHPQLSSTLACTLYSWVGDALRRDLVGRFPVDEAAFKAALDGAVADCADPTAPDPAVPEREEMEERLVGKLHTAGQLRPGYLLRALREGKLGLFELGLACLAGGRVESIRAAIHGDRPDLLAAVCAGVGIDRSVFPTVLSLVRALNNGAPRGGPHSLEGINAAFSTTPEENLARFHSEVGALTAV